TSLDVVIRDEVVAVQMVVVAGKFLGVELAGTVRPAEATGCDGDVSGIVLISDLVPVRPRQRRDVLPVVGELAREEPLRRQDPLIPGSEVGPSHRDRTVESRGWT